MSKYKQESLLLPLGVGFVMASSAQLRTALCMSGVVLLALVLSAAVFSPLERRLPAGGRLPVYALTVTGFVSLLQMLAQAHFPQETAALGVHLAALSVSLIPYAAQKASGQLLAKTGVKAAAKAGLLFALLMIVCALVREVFGSAAIFGVEIPFLQDYRVPALSGVFGGYLVLAAALALGRALAGKPEEKEANRP